ncbi:signal peptidase I [Chthoniobacter flavus Ellin428]|uniref:Signal peptidase I n=1 Tax=Chthoniobacter flavus Ellin428 TaxID=497964 RepID=B4CZM9_9BACT|nr:signal peptidase I [Chthoniobacter flavus]EDY20193.1 signal peptidase I [Chthoniobacter flavus Ellin428]TCO94090.1 signal peptidase I [Chthoniobacter flavus]
MFSFFLPKFVQQGRQFAKDARKILDYKRDLWSEVTVTDFEREIEHLEEGCKERDAQKVESAAQALNALCTSMLPKVEDAAWRENCEVFLVAIVVALAVRTFFIQPFTIPTGSMQPTLNGILGHKTPEDPPNAAIRLWDSLIHGRSWVNVVAQDDESIASVEEVNWAFFFTYTKVETSQGHTYWIHGPMRTAVETWGLNSVETYHRGDHIARGYIDTGDHVFVDKMSYEFRLPRRGDVFVFNTERLPTIDRRHSGSFEPNDPTQFDWPELASFADQWHWKVDMNVPSQFYIKRLVGRPGDTLRIDSPRLYVNGQLAEGAPFARVMAAKDGYEGYSFGTSGFLANILTASDKTFTIPPKHYFAMGDNSYHSSDSRDWGPVPQRNIMGRGLFVYWPFGPHWGFIK